MRVQVQKIVRPAASTIACGTSVNVTDGRLVSFCGDHRPMADLEAALDRAADRPVIAMVEDWQVIGGSADE